MNCLWFSLQAKYKTVKIYTLITTQHINTVDNQIRDWLQYFDTEASHIESVIPDLLVTLIGHVQMTVS